MFTIDALAALIVDLVAALIVGVGVLVVVGAAVRRRRVIDLRQPWRPAAFEPALIDAGDADLCEVL